jgi:hypothetical protein
MQPHGMPAVRNPQAEKQRRIPQPSLVVRGGGSACHVRTGWNLQQVVIEIYQGKGVRPAG